MPELLWAQGGECRSFCGLKGGYAGNFVGLGRVWQNYCGLRGGHAGSFGGFGGGYAGTFLGSRGDYAASFVGSRGGMPELLWAHRGVCRNIWGL